MAVRIPKRGAVRWLPVAEVLREEDPRRAALEGVEFGVRFVGASTAARWGYRFQAIRATEIKRLIEARAGTTAETAPILWAEDFTTPETMRDLAAVYLEVLLDSFAGARGIEGVDPADAVEGLAVVEDLGLLAQLANKAIATQSLTNAEAFC